MDGGSPEPPSSINEQSMPKLNLAKRKDIKFEEQENTPGVSYVTASEEAGWTWFSIEDQGVGLKHLNLIAVVKRRLSTTFRP